MQRTEKKPTRGIKGKLLQFSPGVITQEKRPTRRPKGKLLQFSPGAITQLDLCEEYLLRDELRRVKERHRQMRTWIREQLVLGATIDDSGPRRARLVELFRSNKDGPPTPYTVLLID